MTYNTRQAIEYFHLQFLAQLPMVLDSSLFALKGGCNLRFFFGSIRYSEDIDLDVSTVAVKTLEKNIDKLLNSVSLKSTLKAVGYEISDISKPKQTETTQRWKLQLLSHATNRKVTTKIEFSRRGLDSGIIIERINQSVLDEYNLSRFTVPHYDLKRAFSQKVGALIGRAEPQVRDVFDLDLLISRKGSLPEGESLSEEDKKLAEKTVLDITFEEYTSKVVAYLMPVHQKAYAEEDLWQEIQLRVKNELT